MKYREIIKLLCCVDLVAAILEFTLSMTSAPLMTAEACIREIEQKEKEEEIFILTQNKYLAAVFASS